MTAWLTASSQEVSLIAFFTLITICPAFIYLPIFCPSWSLLLFRTEIHFALFLTRVPAVPTRAFAPTGCSVVEWTSTVTSCVPQDRVWRRSVRNICLFSKQIYPSRIWHGRKLQECATRDSLTQTEIQGTRDPFILFSRSFSCPGESQAGSMC